MGLNNIKMKLAGTTGLEEGGEAAINQLTDLLVSFQKAADDAMAADATADAVQWTNPFDFPVYVVGARYTATTGGITANATNNATVALKTNDGVGGATATALAFTTDVAFGNVSQNQSKAFTTLTPANARIPAGGNLWLNIAKGGSGVVVRAGRFDVRLRRGD
jgi:hypothetical protein